MRGPSESPTPRRSRDRSQPARIGAILALVAIHASGIAQEARRGDRPGTSERTEAPRRPDVIYVPTPQVVVEAMLALARVEKDDVLYDLGCGDGRIVVASAKRSGNRAVGIDIDPRRVRDSLENVRKNGVGHLVTIRRADIFATDLSKATVVTLYLLPTLNARLVPQLARLRPGARVVSHSFVIKGYTPDRVVKVELPDKGVRTLYLYVAPFKPEPAAGSGPRSRGRKSG